MTMTPRVLLDGLAIPESPRWHDGRLWFSNWGTRQIVAVDLNTGASGILRHGSASNDSLILDRVTKDQVVSAGDTIVACSTSSKPTTERSSGTRRPRARAA